MHGSKGLVFEVLAGPVREPAWSRTWSPDGANTHRALRHLVDGKPWRFWDIRGRASHSLTVQPPEEYVFDASKVRGARAAWVERAAAVVGSWAREHGYRLRASRPERFTNPDGGVLVRGLPAFGRPGQDPIWSDDSLEIAGASELEFPLDDVGEAVGAAVLDLPRRNEQIDAWRARVRAELDAIREVVLETVRTQRVVVESHARLASPVPAREARVGLDPRDDPGVR